jgi:hypothetical protein
LVPETGELVRLSFEIESIQVRQHKIEHRDTPLDELDFVLSPVTEILAANLTVEPPGKQMIDDATHWKAFRPGVFLGVKFAPEGGRPFAPMGSGEREELTCNKVARMRCHEVQEPRFLLGVADGLKSIEMGGFNVHK